MEQCAKILGKNINGQALQTMPTLGTFHERRRVWRGEICSTVRTWMDNSCFLYIFCFVQTGKWQRRKCPKKSLFLVALQCCVYVHDMPCRANCIPSTVFNQWEDGSYSWRHILAKRRLHSHNHWQIVEPTVHHCRSSISIYVAAVLKFLQNKLSKIRLKWMIYILVTIGGHF